MIPRDPDFFTGDPIPPPLKRVLVFVIAVGVALVAWWIVAIHMGLV